jgi:hypothetical protein
MDNNRKKYDQPGSQDTSADYNPANRDFQRTEEDLDNISKPEKEELERRKSVRQKQAQSRTKNV